MLSWPPPQGVGPERAAFRTKGRAGPAPRRGRLPVRRHSGPQHLSSPRFPSDQTSSGHTHTCAVCTQWGCPLLGPSHSASAKLWALLEDTEITLGEPESAIREGTCDRDPGKGKWGEDKMLTFVRNFCLAGKQVG